MCSTTGQLTSLAKTVFKAIVQAGCSHPATLRGALPPGVSSVRACHVCRNGQLDLLQPSFARRPTSAPDRFPSKTFARHTQDTQCEAWPGVCCRRESPGWVRVGHGQSPTWARNSRMACLTQNKSNVSAARLLSPQVGLAPWLQVKMRTCVCKLQSGAY